MNLARYVREGLWSELEDNWTELILGEAPVQPALEAVAAAAQKKEIPRLLPLVREHGDMLRGSERAAAAAELLGETMLLGGSPGELARPLYESAKEAWGDESFWEAYVEIAGLHENTPDMRSAWRAFRKLLALAPGRVVYHAKGWGLGLIEELDASQRQVVVRFRTGKRDRFPFQSAVDIFQFLDESDLRSLVVTDPEELERLLTKEPLEVLRWIVQRNDGRANQAAIKLAMTTLGVEGARFAAWWRKAKKLADTSEWFELSGPSARVTVRMLDVAEDPAEGIRRQLKRSKSMSDALLRVRTLTTGKAEASVVDAAIETLEELARDEVHYPLPGRMAAWLFLRERQGQTPEPLQRMLAEAAGAEGSAGLWALFQRVPGVREQERCIELLQEVHPDDWLDRGERNLSNAAPGMVRGLVEALEEAGRTPELVRHYNALIARPAKNPVLLVRLAERIELGADDADLAPRLQRAQCLLQLAVHLNRAGARDASLARSRSRLSEILTAGDPPLLRRLLEGSSLDALRNLSSLVDSGVERSVDRAFTQVALAISPEVFRGEERAFWEGEAIWTTRSGLARRQEELRILREVKIPENAEAIGKAASYGDLSENSEWEAAIEEQRNLTNRAMALEAEIREARLLENAPKSEDTVAPGTRVRYREADDDQEREIDIVGPWDVEDEHHVSYRSPLGAGLLGKHGGEKVTVKVPSGRIEVEVLSVEPLETS